MSASNVALIGAPSRYWPSCFRSVVRDSTPLSMSVALVCHRL